MDLLGEAKQSHSYGSFAGTGPANDSYLLAPLALE